jgi:hypothetical protein
MNMAFPVWQSDDSSVQLVDTKTKYNVQVANTMFSKNDTIF